MQRERGAERGRARHERPSALCAQHIASIGIPTKLRVHGNTDGRAARAHAVTLAQIRNLQNTMYTQYVYIHTGYVSRCACFPYVLDMAFSVCICRFPVCMYRYPACMYAYRLYTYTPAG